MAKWQRTLDIRDAWDKASSREIKANELARVIADGLEKLRGFGIQHVDDKKKEIIEEFRMLAIDSYTDYDTLDCVLRELYDWGDIPLDTNFAGKKVCWIKTF